MPEGSQGEYVFGPFRLHSVDGLFRGSVQIPLRPKALLVLLYLVQHAGRVVTPTNIFRDLWTDTTVEARGLKTYISQIRGALGDSVKDQVYIETLPKRGYRFKAGCRRVELDVRMPVAESPTTERTTTVSGLSDSQETAALAKLFPYTFADFPTCFFSDDAFDVSIIAGSSSREMGPEVEAFHARESHASILGVTHSFSRHVSHGTPRDHVRVSDLAAFLGAHYALATRSQHLTWPDGTNSICRLDITTSQRQLERNLILVGAADTNVYIALATMAFRRTFGVSLPIRFAGDDGQYFTCDQIYSELSGRTYSRLEESSYMHCGYLLMAANPWAPSKIMLLAIGTRATGTQAALLALIRGRDMFADERPYERWHMLATNNRQHDSIPAKVVRARRAAVIPDNDFIADEQVIDLSERSRVSQRHVITDFEFLE